MINCSGNSKKIWYGRCIFISWYCDVGTCTFCYRSTIKHKIRHKEVAKRTMASMLVEALLCKVLNWRIEFLTGGYRVLPFPEIVNIAKNVSKVYGEKIWVNLGSLNKDELEQLKPYVKGVVASIETVEEKLHKKICPDKSIKPYLEMYEEADKLGYQKSATIVIGLGEKREDFLELKKFIQKNELDRITFYALKPVYGADFKHGPTTEEYLWWLKKTREEFPELQIIAGTTARRYEEVGQLLENGADAFTKFPATKLFGTEKARVIEEKIKEKGFLFNSTLTELPDVNWNEEVDSLDIDEELKEQVKIKLKDYLQRMNAGKDV